MKTFTPIGWLRGFLYFGIGGALVAGGTFYLVRPGMAVPGRVLGGIIVLATVYIVARLVQLRLAYAAQIAWYARVGANSQIAVLPGEARDWLAARRSELEGQINRAWRWWAARYPEHADLIEECFDGTELAVLAQPGPLRDPRLTGHYRGLTTAGKMRVWFPLGPDGQEAFMKGFAGREWDEVFWAVLRHEVAHKCLFAIGVPDTHHHERMRTDGCPDA